MKKILLFTLSINLFTHLLSQKIIPNGTFLAYKILPSEKLATTSNNYQIELIWSDSSEHSHYRKIDSGIKLYEKLAGEETSTAIDKKYEMLNLENSGLVYEPDSSGVLVRMIIGSVHIYPNSETSTDHFFDYKVASRLQIIDATGIIIFNEEIHDPNSTYQFDSDEISRNAFAQHFVEKMKAMPEKAEKISQKITSEAEYFVATDALIQAQELLSRYKAIERKQYISFFGLKGKEYTDLNDATEQVIDLHYKTSALSAKKRITYSQFQKGINDAIPIWKKYESDDQLENEAREAILSNLATAHFFLQDSIKCIEFLNQIEGSSSKWIENLYHPGVATTVATIAKMNNEFIQYRDRIERKEGF